MSQNIWKILLSTGNDKINGLNLKYLRLLELQQYRKSLHEYSML